MDVIRKKLLDAIPTAVYCSRKPVWDVSIAYVVGNSLDKVFNSLPLLVKYSIHDPVGSRTQDDAHIFGS